MPALREHAASGRAYARWRAGDERRVKYFGPWGSAEAKAAYRQFSLLWLSGAPQVSGDGDGGDGPTVAGVASAWLDHCERTYRKRGKITSEVYLCRAAVGPLNEAFGGEPVAEFDGRKLQAVREAMVLRTWKRTTINDHCARLCRLFSWAAAEGLVPAAPAALERVEPLVAGRRADVAEREVVRPVPAADVEAVLGCEGLDRAAAGTCCGR